MASVSSIIPPLDPLQGDTIIISVNPRAGSGQLRSLVDDVAQSLVQLGFETSVCTDVERVAQLCETLHDAGRLRGVLAAGGDGSAALMLNRLPAGTPVAVLPLGTENLLADFLEHRADLELVGRLFTGGRVAR